MRDMARRAATQTEITHAVKAMQACGLTIGSVEVDGSKIVVLTAGYKLERLPSESEELDCELAEFEARHGQS